MGVFRYVLAAIIIFSAFGCTKVPEDQICISKEELSDEASVKAFIENALTGAATEGDITDLEDEIKKLEDELKKEDLVEETPKVTPKETAEETPKGTPKDTPMETPTSTPKPKETASAALAVKEFTEGDLVSIKPKATDADGDKITFTFSSPLDANGEWKTQVGDAGEYIVTITADDGKAQVAKKLKLVIKPSNNPPVISNVKDITVEEGGTVALAPEVTDADNDQVTIRYSGWKDVPSFKVDYNDAGDYSITVIASDGKSETRKDVKIKVLNKNRAPEIQEIKAISVDEGQLVQIEPTVSDPDGDALQVSYSEPINEKGEWQTKIGDAGNYIIQVKVKDNELETVQRVTVVVRALNRAPKITVDRSMTVNIGDIVTLNPTIIDEDGDDIKVTYTGWMTTNTKPVTAEDAGITHTVTIKASDGKSESSVDVKIEVNSPPVFEI